MTRTLFLLLASVGVVQSAPVAVTSPDGNLHLSIAAAADGRLTWSLQAAGRELIAPSPLGFAGSRIAGTKGRRINSEWRPLWGKRTVVPDRFHEQTLDLGGYQIVARAYDDGVAFRYLLPGSFPARDDSTAFSFAGDYTAWFYNGEYHNLGPEKLSAIDGKRLPVMTVKVDAQACLAIHEADLALGQPLVLESKKGETTFRVASKPSEAWRVIMFGRTPGDMVDSHLIELLNPPPPADIDFSWVKPGLAVWDWRINGAKADGFQYMMSLPSWKRMVDFAAANKIPHLVLDAGWYGPEFGRGSDPVKGGKAAQVREIITRTRHTALLPARRLPSCARSRGWRRFRLPHLPRELPDGETNRHP